jgi:DNA-binding CsgD family transcriptional regulator
MAREQELAAIDHLLADVTRGVGGLLWIEGAPGLGKSRLMTEGDTRGSALGVEVLSARARKGEGENPFGVVLQLFEARLATEGASARRALLAGAAGLASPLFDGRSLEEWPATSPSAFSLVHGLYWLTLNLANGRPLLLCIDDVQWADEASARFLAYLADRLEDLPIGLLVGGRPPGPGDADSALFALRQNPTIQRRVLRTLDPGSVREVVRSSFPGADEEFCAVCAAVTEGNPFFVNEVLIEVTAQRLEPVAVSSERLRDLGVATLSRAALFRLARLGQSARAVAEAVAILGDGTPLRRAAALSQLEVGVAGLAADALAGEGILLPGEPLSFLHPLIRASVVAEIAPLRRGLAHQRAARLLDEETAPPEQIGAQLLDAPGSGQTWAVSALRAAARLARIRGAPESAVRFLGRALEEPPEQERMPELLAELGAAEVAAGMAGDASVHLRAALEREGDSRARAGIARLLARSLADENLGSQAATVLEEAMDAAGDQDLDLAHTLLGDYLACTVFEPSLRQRAFARVDPQLQLLGHGSAASEGPALAALALRSAQEARPVAGTIALAKQAWGDGTLLAREGPDGSTWLMIVWALELAEDYETSSHITATAIDAARRSGSVTAFSAASYFHGYGCLRRGRLVEAQADAEQAMRVADSAACRYAGVAGILRALALIERGEINLAEEGIAAARTELTSMLAAPWRLHALGRVALARHQPAEALDLFVQAGAWLHDRLSVEHTVLPWRIDAADAALVLGDTERATELVRPFQVLAERANAPIAQAKVWGILGRVEGGDRGIALLERSANGLAETQSRLDYAYALTNLGAALRRAGRRSESRTLFSTALDLAQRLDSRLLAQRVSGELAVAGARPRREAITGAGALTPSEQRVGRLAAQHLTNHQIAQSLFVTPKTVEYHLRHVYQKLGIAGRRELKAVLAGYEPCDTSMAPDTPDHA